MGMLLRDAGTQGVCRDISFAVGVHGLPYMVGFVRQFGYRSLICERPGQHVFKLCRSKRQAVLTEVLALGMRGVWIWGQGREPKPQSASSVTICRDPMWRVWVANKSLLRKYVKPTDLLKSSIPLCGSKIVLDIF